MLTTDAINDFKDFIDNIIAYAKVTVDGTTTKMRIERRERLADGRVAVYIQITPQASYEVKVTKVQLYNKNNRLWAEKTEDLPIKNVQEGILYRFVFNFEEKLVNCLVRSLAGPASVTVANKLLFKEWVQLSVYGVLCHTVLELQRHNQSLFRFVDIENVVPPYCVGLPDKFIL